jgi:anti-sigma factor RsiW
MWTAAAVPTRKSPMSPTPRTRRIGRLRTLVVLAAMAVGMIAGTAAPALAEEDAQPHPAADRLEEKGVNPSGIANGMGVAGWSWLR